MAIQTCARGSRQEGGVILCNGSGIVRRSEENLGLEDAAKERIAGRRRRRSKEGDENCSWNLNIPDDGAGRKRAKQEWNSSVEEEFDKNPSAAVGRVREPTEVSMVASNTQALGKQVLMEIMTAESCSSQGKTEPMSKEPETIELSSSSSDDSSSNSDEDDDYGIARKSPRVPETNSLSPEDMVLLRNVLDVIKEAGDLKKLKVDELKTYLRYCGLRLSGIKATLIERIQEHMVVKDGGGEAKYRRSTFSIDCTGDVVQGDVVLFNQQVYDSYDFISRCAAGLALGKRMVAGRVVSDSYGAAKQQHTFTIEVLWSTGVQPLPAMYPLQIKGRNLYRPRTLRQPWLNEEDRQAALVEKHSRGEAARKIRAAAKANTKHSHLRSKEPATQKAGSAPVTRVQVQGSFARRACENTMGGGPGSNPQHSFAENQQHHHNAFYVAAPPVTSSSSLQNPPLRRANYSVAVTNYFGTNIQMKNQHAPQFEFHHQHLPKQCMDHLSQQVPLHRHDLSTSHETQQVHSHQHGLSIDHVTQRIPSIQHDLSLDHVPKQVPSYQHGLSRDHVARLVASQQHDLFMEHVTQQVPSHQHDLSQQVRSQSALGRAPQPHCMPRQHGAFLCPTLGCQNWGANACIQKSCYMCCRISGAACSRHQSR
ncbi:unnamed protein product [Sphagnum tenellum]